MIVQKRLVITEFDNKPNSNLGNVLSKYVRFVNQSPTTFIDVGTFTGFSKSLKSKRRRVPNVQKGEVLGIVQRCQIENKNLLFDIEILERYQFINFDNVNLKARFYCRIEDSDDKESYCYHVLHLVSVYVDLPRILVHQ